MKINLHKNLHGNFGRFIFVLSFTQKVNDMYKIEVFTKEGVKTIGAKIQSVSVYEPDFGGIDIEAINDAIGFSGEEAKNVVFMSDDPQAVVEISRSYPNCPIKFETV